MKRTFVILALALLVISTVSSCASARSSRGGCKATQGFLGYGSR